MAEEEEESSIFRAEHSKCLSVQLVQDEAGVARDVFLYCKSHLRPGAAVPEPETLPASHIDGELNLISSTTMCPRTHPAPSALHLELSEALGCERTPRSAEKDSKLIHLPLDKFIACAGCLAPTCAPVEPTRAQCAEPAPSSIRYEAHPLDSVRSPLLQALPNFERQFRGHLRRGQAFQAAAAARLAAAEQLIAEMVGIWCCACPTLSADFDSADVAVWFCHR